MPVLNQAGRSAQPKQGLHFHNPTRRRLWKTLISISLLWRNYKAKQLNVDLVTGENVRLWGYSYPPINLSEIP